MEKAKEICKIIINVKAWEKNTKRFFFVVIGTFLIMTIFAFLKPSKEEMMACASDNTANLSISY